MGKMTEESHVEILRFAQDGSVESSGRQLIISRT